MDRVVFNMLFIMNAMVHNATSGEIKTTNKIRLSGYQANNTN
jgi:hypothetical protein